MAPLNLPPADKLPLATRKNVRDEFENNRADLEKQLSDVLGEEWKIDIDPLKVWPYHAEGYAQTSLGSCIKDYIEGAIYQIKYFIERNGDTAKDEINSVCHAHLIQLAEDQTGKFSYSGVVVDDGALRIVFKQNNLGTNVSYALESLATALNDAPQAAGKTLSVKARLGIEQDYNAKVGEQVAKFEAMLNVKPFTLSPNFEDNFGVLRDSKAKDVRDDWQQNMGSFALAYFDGAHYQMTYQKFGEDDMLQEGFNEEVSKHEIALRVVDTLKKGSGYSEVFIEDGVLVIQTTPQNFGTNVSYACEKVLDLL